MKQKQKKNIMQHIPFLNIMNETNMKQNVPHHL